MSGKTLSENNGHIVWMDVSIFLICKCAVVNNEKVKRIIANSTLCCFGIYMVHFFFVGPIVNTCMKIMHIGLVIPVSAILTLAVSWAFVAIAYRIIGPKAKWIFG